MRSLLLILACVGAVAACHAEAPPPIGFTGTCELIVQGSPGIIQHLPTPNEQKTRVVLEIHESTLVSMHVELPDDRNDALGDLAPDDPLLVGEARPNLGLDLDTDVDVPVELSRKDVEAPWELHARVVFHGATADAVVGRMHVTGNCVARRAD